ncbi:hypothetical protein FHS29_001228 [Saccharothrix tamanrassetensis]|uniref:Uncharacterized protein n=1 Tax=Saccharothrix tamanrassetensis TaxID=1051531 RepID=A0A841CEQ7_9PSEU|nr:hypothetical protein [Saccharothrix tamanrassetensis]MBB5954658.1 hypothetical protein [Saccharothrix tamanrassetensis]
MAVSDAARRSGSLLLRALAVGGLATVAWLCCAGLASADDQDHSDELSTTLDTVNLAVDQQHTATTALLDIVLAEQTYPEAAVDAAVDPLALPTPVEAVLPMPAVPAVPIPAIPVVPGVPVVPEFQLATPAQVISPFEDMTPAHTVSAAAMSSVGIGSPAIAPLQVAAPEEQPGQYGQTSYSGGTESRRYSHSGTVVNTMPEEMYEAKVAAKVAARQAALAPPPVPEPAAPQEVVPTAPSAFQAATVVFTQEPAPVSTADAVTTSTVTWEKPEPASPAPAPKPAPAPTAPTTASSSPHDSSNGHRGGVIAFVTSQQNFTPPTARSVERRDDWRSPGSIPGLPSTSPD